MPEKIKISFEEFSEIDRNNDELMEFIDGEIYPQASLCKGRLCMTKIAANN